MRRKPGLENAAPGPSACSPREALRERVSRDLQMRALSAAAADALAERVACEVEGQNPHDYERTLDGVALGFRVQGGLADDLSQNSADLQEIERLMTSFAGELNKLDEVLEVLAAYLRRMRTVSPARRSTILH